jgi:hypothetical protein
MSSSNELSISKRIKGCLRRPSGLSDSSKSSTGEFDPGSERTLAARLTHASRTRKGFGPGTVAHG